MVFVLIVASVGNYPRDSCPIHSSLITKGPTKLDIQGYLTSKMLGISRYFKLLICHKGYL